MSARGFFSRLGEALRAIRISRAAILILVSLALALASDWLRTERVVFPAPLPPFTTVPG